MHGKGTHRDEVLLKKLSGGDESAFNELFACYRNQLYSYLLKIVKSKETAEEIVLDVFVKIWVRREIAGEIDNFEAFLFRIAHNQAIDFLRAAQKNSVVRDEIRENMLKAATETSDDRVRYKDADAAVQMVIQQLSPQRQTVFQLSRDHGLTYDEIAVKLQLSRNTVRNHLSASLQFIRSRLGQEIYLLLLIWLLGNY